MQKTRRYTRIADILAILALAFCAGLLPTTTQAAEARTLNVLFIGNSFTHRGGLPQVVKELSEAGNPGLRLHFIASGGSGAKLDRHWSAGTLDYLRLAEMTAQEQRAAIQSLRDVLAKDPNDMRAKAALGRHRRFQALGAERRKWDVVAWEGYSQFQQLRKGEEQER